MTAKLVVARLCALIALNLGCAPAAPPESPVAAATWAPLTQQALLGSWELTDVSSQPVPRGISLSFSSNGLVRGSLTCGNELFGNYRVLPHRIGFFMTRVTQRGCDPLRLHEAAEKTLLRPFSSYLSPDLRHLYVRGQETLLFSRRPTDAEMRPVVAKDDIQGRWTITSVNGRQSNGLWLELGGEGLPR